MFEGGKKYLFETAIAKSDFTRQNPSEQGFGTDYSSHKSEFLLLYFPISPFDGTLDTGFVFSI